MKIFITYSFAFFVGWINSFGICYDSFPDTNRLTILFAGDIMGHDAQISAAWYADSNAYDYRECFSGLEPFIQSSDIAIGNLEVTLAGEPYKGYPQFSSPDELAVALKMAGFDILVNANNHALDRGKEGLERTIRITKQEGMIMTGTFESQEARETLYPLIIEKNNILLAILNYTYGTNGITTSSPNIVNYIDSAMITEDIRKAKLADPDFILAVMHWGNEYERNADARQQALARFLIRSGVNAIIGSHPHVIQPLEKMDDGTNTAYSIPVIYSLGNFISNQRERYRDGGIIFSLELTKTDKTIASDYSWLPVWVQKPVINGVTRFRLVPANLSAVDKESLKLTSDELKRMDEFYNDTRSHLQNIKENKIFTTGDHSYTTSSREGTALQQ